MIIHTTVNCFVRVCMRRFSWVVGGAQALDAGALPTATASFKAFCCHFLLIRSMMCCSQLSAMDVSVRSTMKGAAKCDKHCELQNSVNRQGLERILCFWDIPKSMPASVSILCCFSGCRFHQACCCECLCLKMCWSFLVVLLRHAIDKAPL